MKNIFRDILAQDVHYFGLHQRIEFQALIRCLGDG